MAGLKPRLPLLFVSLYLLSFFADGCAPRSVAPRHRRPQGIYHVVKSRENLFRIGKAYDVPYRELAWINRIRNPHEIRVGQRIFVPGATRQLPVEIITPETFTMGRPTTPFRDGKGWGRFIWPVVGEVSSNFGPRGETFHDGVDISAPEGSPIRAVERGEVVFSDELRGYGKLIIIRHPEGFATVYSHNRTNLAQEAQRVERGEVIAEVGSTGRVTGPHLHFEIRRDNVAQNPLYYLPQL